MIERPAPSRARRSALVSFVLFAVAAPIPETA
jgi:hypothetical protein